MRPSGRGARQPILIIAVFFFVFAGPGALQGYIRNVAGDGWAEWQTSSILPILYFSFMLWRLLIPASQRLFGDKRSLVLGASAYCLMPIVLALGGGYGLSAVCAAVWGWGAAGLWQTGPVWLHDATDERRRGLWTGFLYGAVFLGLMLGVEAQGYAVGHFSRTGHLVFAMSPGLAGLVAALFLPGRRSKAQRLTLGSIVSMLADRRVLVLGLLLFASATAYGLLLSAFRDNIQSAFGKGALGSILACYFAVRLLVSVAGGYISDILPRKTVMAAAFLAGGLALFGAAAQTQAWAFGLAAACLGLVSGAVPVSATSYAGDWFPTERRSLALGAAFIWRDAGVVSSLLAGHYLVYMAGGFVVPLYIFAGLFAICGVVSFALPGRHVQAEGVQ